MEVRVYKGDGGRTGGEGRGYRKERREGSGGHMEWWLRGPVGLHVGLCVCPVLPQRPAKCILCT